MNISDVFQPGFATQLKADPAGKLRELGITPTPELLDALEKFSVTELEKTINLLQEGAKGAQPQPMAWP